MLQLSLVCQNKIIVSVIMLKNVSDTNYVLNGYKNLCEYDVYAMPSKIMPCCSYPASWVDLFDTLSYGVNELI